MIITPDAGTVKNKEARIVPLHQHLVDEGFLGFVQGCPDGYLFLEVKSPKGVDGKRRTLKNRLQEFVRKIVPDPEVQPNHAWRHTFKTRGREANIEARVLDAIQGHAPRTEGERYGSVTVKTLADAMGKFPKFDA